MFRFGQYCDRTLGLGFRAYPLECRIQRSAKDEVPPGAHLVSFTDDLLQSEWKRRMKSHRTSSTLFSRIQTGRQVAHDKTEVVMLTKRWAYNQLLGSASGVTQQPSVNISDTWESYSTHGSPSGNTSRRSQTKLMLFYQPERYPSTLSLRIGTGSRCLRIPYLGDPPHRIQIQEGREKNYNQRVSQEVDPFQKDSLDPLTHSQHRKMGSLDSSESPVDVSHDRRTERLVNA